MLSEIECSGSLDSGHEFARHSCNHLRAIVRDPRGSFLAAKAAEPVYALFGEPGLGVDDMPAVATPVGHWIGFHNRRGSHGIDEYDWEQFLNFADRHFRISRAPK